MSKALLPISSSSYSNATRGLQDHANRLWLLRVYLVVEGWGIPPSLELLASEDIATEVEH